MKDDNCIFCKLANGDIPTRSIYEDDMFKVIMDAAPATKGHCLILPKDHAANLYELPDETAGAAMILAKKLATKMTKRLHADGFNLVQNNGEVAGQTVFHFHLHLIPRYNDDKNGDKLCWNHEEFTDEQMDEIHELLVKDSTPTFTPEEGDVYAALAKKALETYVREKKIIPDEAELPAELLSRKAPCFVSLFVDGQLRGCVGSAWATRPAIAWEIMEFAVTAGTYDVRCEPIKEEELSKVVYRVDVIGDMVEVDGPETLDHKKYGVVVSDGVAQGLVLPDMPEIEDVQHQLETAQSQAEIMPGTPVSIHRFEVERHEG